MFILAFRSSGSTSHQGIVRFTAYTDRKGEVVLQWWWYMKMCSLHTKRLDAFPPPAILPIVCRSGFTSSSTQVNAYLAWNEKQSVNRSRGGHIPALAQGMQVRILLVPLKIRGSNGSAANLASECRLDL